MTDSSVAMHRAYLLNILRDGLPSRCTTHYNKRLVSYAQSDGCAEPVTLFFADGSVAEADVVIGADGINSATRQTMFSHYPTDKHFARASWTGTYCYRSLVDATKVLKAMPGHQAASIPIIVSLPYCIPCHSLTSLCYFELVQYMGKDKHIVSYPINEGKLINYLGFYTAPGREGSEYEGPSVVDASCNELVQLFEDWEPEASTLSSVGISFHFRTYFRELTLQLVR